MTGTAYPVTQCHISEERNPKLDQMDRQALNVTKCEPAHTVMFPQSYSPRFM